MTWRINGVKRNLKEKRVKMSSEERRERRTEVKDENSQRNGTVLLRLSLFEIKIKS